MSLRARMFLGVALAAAFVAGTPQAAGAAAAAPVIVPAPDSDSYPNIAETPGCFPRAGYTQSNDLTKPWRNCLLPDRDANVDWPNPSTPVTAAAYYWPTPLPGAELRANGFRANRSFILPRPGLYVSWLGFTLTTDGYPLIWYDVGSGTPVTPASGPWQFTLAGKYEWECLNCAGNPGAFDSVRARLQGTMYVIGPRAKMTSRLAAPDNSGASIAYEFDASGSFVTDYNPYSIVKYEFDFQDDGVFDQSSPEPTAQATLAPGPHIVRVRVTDDHVPARTGEWPLFLQIPFVRAGNPEPNPSADLGKDKINPTGVKFSKANVRLKAAKRIRVTVLRRKGLSVKVSGLTKGDRIRARLLKGKKSIVASGSATTLTATKTVRLRVGRAGKRTLSRRPRPKRLVLDVAVEGTDGFQITKRVAVRISS